jgi:acetyl esterase/lipase
MPAAWILFAAGCLGLVLAANVLRPIFAPGPIAVVSFFAGWLVGELAPHAMAGQLLCAALMVHAGALAAWPGTAGLALVCASCAALVVAHVRATRSRRVFERALRDAFGDAAHASPDHPVRTWLSPALGILPIAFPFPVRHRHVTCRRNVEFWTGDGLTLRLDVHLPVSNAHHTPAPTLVYVHGGAWMVGYRERQGLPLLQHLAARGWACSVDYRLSPQATFPDHLVDVKRAIAWVREHAAEYGADPGFLVVAGNSAGGHLASLAALTANDPLYQPGFEGSDTSIQACAAFYGVYDFADRNGHWHNGGMRRLLERHVMKRPREAARAAYDAASPITRVHADAPPFLLVHGTCDSLCPVGEARSFFDALRGASRDVVAYAEVPGAQHAFEVFPSVRTAHTLDGVARFLALVYARQLRVAARPVRRSGFTQSRAQSRAAGT